VGNRTSLEKMVKTDLLKKAYQGKKVFLTGHTGFKGSWLLLMLHQLGAIVKGYSLAPVHQNDLYHQINGDNFCDSQIDDIRNQETLIKSMVDFQPDFVIHMAAQALVIDSYKAPVETYQTNVMGTIHVLEGLRKLNKPCNSIIITTDKVYWNFERDTPYKETDQLGGYDPYSNSKAAADITINSYQKSFFNLDNFEEHQQGISTVRSGNVIGGGDMAENRIIPDCVKSLENNQPISVRNPNAVRPWQHVLDPLYGYLLLGAKLQEEPKKYSEAFNFGPETEDVNTVKELVEIAIKSWGHGEASFPKITNKLHEAGLLKLDIEKAKTQLGWKPQYQAETAIQKTIEWYKNAKPNPAEYTLNQIEEFLATPA
jgi:CDP-glucose 4,6-dehydratase